MNEKLLEIARKAQELEKLIESTPECYSVEVYKSIYPVVKAESEVHITDPGPEFDPELVVRREMADFCYLRQGNVKFVWLR